MELAIKSLKQLDNSFDNEKLLASMVVEFEVFAKTEVMLVMENTAVTIIVSNFPDFIIIHHFMIRCLRQNNGYHIKSWVRFFVIQIIFQYYKSQLHFIVF